MSWVSDRIEYAALSGFFALCRVLSRQAALRLARVVGDLLYDGVRIRRRIALANLAASFPGMERRKIERIAHSCYRNFAKTAVEFARLPAIGREDLLEQVEVVGLEHLEAIAARGRGAVLVTGHFGNWEWMAPFFPAHGLPTHVVSGPQRNRLVEALMDRVRRSGGVGVLSAEKDLRGIMLALQRGELVAIVADQDAGRDGIFVDFLGRPASTAVGPVRLARRFGVPILLGFSIHRPEGGIRMELHPPIVVPQEGEEREVVRRYTMIWSEMLESYVRRYPDHWFWMHRRWKTQPVGQALRRGETSC